MKPTIIVKHSIAATIVAVAVLATAPFGRATRPTVLPGAEPAQYESYLIGNWSGDSICQVKNSPCHDEKVVYHISKSGEPGKVTVSADKIVDGKPINMGSGNYTYDQKEGTLVNETERAVWKFTVKGNRMEGTLTLLPDKTLYRHVTLKKQQ